MAPSAVGSAARSSTGRGGVEPRAGCSIGVSAVATASASAIVIVSPRTCSLRVVITRSSPSSFTMRARVTTVGPLRPSPRSSSLKCAWVVPILVASSIWLKPLAVRSCLISSPTEAAISATFAARVASGSAFRSRSKLIVALELRLMGGSLTTDFQTPLRGPKAQSLGSQRQVGRHRVSASGSSEAEDHKPLAKEREDDHRTAVTTIFKGAAIRYYISLMLR